MCNLNKFVSSAFYYALMFVSLFEQDNSNHCLDFSFYVCLECLVLSLLNNKHNFVYLNIRRNMDTVKNISLEEQPFFIRISPTFYLFVLFINSSGDILKVLI